MPRATPAAPLYLAHVVPGLEELAAGELAGPPWRVQGAGALRGFDERTSLLRFRYRGAPRDLLDLSLVEDIFALAAESETVPGGWSGLAAIRDALAASPDFDPAVAVAAEVRRVRTRSATFRVVARKAGEHAFRRVDVQQAAERAVAERFPRWRLVDENAQAELWLHLVGSHLIAGLRLSGDELRQRTYLRVSLPAALKPTVARAMVTLSRPRPDDVFLDPMCGAGTILIERALAGRYRLLLGGDLDPHAVEATETNVGTRYQPIEIRQWDARTLPLDTGSVSAIVTNLPFGRQVGSAAENRALYPALLAEWTRVLQAGGRMVLLTSDAALLRRALARHPELRQQQRVQVLVRGVPAAIHVLRHTGAA